MALFQPVYVPYKKRMFIVIIDIIIYAVLPSIILLATGSTDYLKPFLVLFGTALAISIYLDFRRNKKYLKSIEISSDRIKLVVVEKDKELPEITSSIENSSIKIPEQFIFSKGGRKFALQADIKSNGKFETVWKQYETGNWNLELFKEVYKAYCDAKNVTYNDASLKRSFF